MFKYIANKLKKVTTMQLFNRNNNVNITFLSDFLYFFLLKCICVCLQIYPDPESEKTIMGSVVYCIHHKEGCQWSDELRKLKVSLALYIYMRVRTIF